MTVVSKIRQSSTSERLMQLTLMKHCRFSNAPRTNSYILSEPSMFAQTATVFSSLDFPSMAFISFECWCFIMSPSEENSSFIHDVLERSSYSDEQLKVRISKTFSKLLHLCGQQRTTYSHRIGSSCLKHSGSVLKVSKH